MDYLQYLTQLPSIKLPAIQLPSINAITLSSVQFPQLPSINSIKLPPLPPQARDLLDKIPPLKPEELKLATYTALGITTSGALILLVRRADRSAPAVEITSLDDFNQYRTGGVFRDVAAWLFTPKVTAVRVTGHGDRIPTLPRAICSLIALTELKISNNAITQLPQEISRLTSLQTLDISGNALTSLPDEIGALTALISLNAMNNRLENLPSSIGNLSALQSLGLKGNRLVQLPQSIGKLSKLKELFVTDNLLEELPEEIGGCSSLVKLQASHNALHDLPSSLGALSRLELLRVSCCDIVDIPSSLSGAHSLAWLSLATNPLCHIASPRRNNTPLIAMKDIEVGKKLGDGASGEVFESTWRNRRVALKLFRSDRSPDGHSKDEIAVACALSDRHLIKVLGRIEEPLALVMEYVPGAPLAEKPDHESLLRCRWEAGNAFDLSYVLRVAISVASALEHMHSRGIAHGDVYAHNVIADVDGSSVLCDYGAAFFYPKNGAAAAAAAYEGQDIRGFGLLLRDMVERLDVGFVDMETTLDAQKQLLLLVQQCTTGAPAARPRFGALARKLRSLEKSSAGSTPRSDSRLSVKLEKAANGLYKDGAATAR